MSLVRALAVACVAAWLGIMVFFSFAVAPVVFRAIDRAAAGQAVAAVLPRYYGWGMALSAAALVGFALVAVAGHGRLRHLLAAVACAIMLASLVWASTVSLPQADAARRAGDDTGFARAHRHSVQLNGIAMLAAAAALVAGGVSPTARRGR